MGEQFAFYSWYLTRFVCERGYACTWCRGEWWMLQAGAT